MDFQEKTNKLLEEQKRDWKLLRDNHEGLGKVKNRSFDYGHYHIRLQFNPKRIVSSGAKVDKDSIRKRACFLCKGNRPAEQESVLFEKNWEILCNPFPIFERHITISSIEHSPQLINNKFINMLSLSKALPEMAVFYNGPKCGASAPDHMHFQAGNCGMMPIEEDLPVLVRKYGKILHRDKNTELISVEDGLRNFIVIDSTDEAEIESIFSLVYAKLNDFSSGEEPMLNILSYYNNAWRVFIFPRERHRPVQYDLKGDKNILFSPASVDMGGTLIIPLEKDFNKIDESDIRDMFRQVSLDSSKFSELITFIQQSDL